MAPMNDESLHPAQIAAYRRMTAEEKLAQSMALYWAARELKADALRRRHPEWPEADVQAAVRELFLLATT